MSNPASCPEVSRQGGQMVNEGMMGRETPGSYRAEKASLSHGIHHVRSETAKGNRDQEASTLTLTLQFGTSSFERL